MWWVKTKRSDEDRGGFQNRDSGRYSFNNDYGPDFGVDYARFSDPPNILKDFKIKEAVSQQLQKFEKDLCEYELRVRNGFVLLKGYVRDSETKKNIIETLYGTEGVKEVINNLQIFKPTH